MRDALNSNPLVQAAVIGVLLIGGAIFVLSMGGGKEEEAGEAPASSVEAAPASEAAPEAVEGGVEAATESGSAAEVAGLLAGASVPPPKDVREAYESGATVVLLVVHDGGIEDRIVKKTTEALSGFENASVFIVPADKISRYAAITAGVGVERVPALVVVAPRGVDHGTPTASVNYGFQSPESIAQAVIDAGYKGPTLNYHP